MFTAFNAPSARRRYKVSKVDWGETCEEPPPRAWRRLNHTVQDEELLSEVHIMTTMPGVSFISAYSILAEIGSLKQYSAKELSSLSGLAPRIIESGSSVHSSYLGRRSSGRLRQILYLDSLRGLPKIPALQEVHQRLVVKGKKKMTARCACMRKMLLVLRSMVVHSASPKGSNRDRP